MTRKDYIAIAKALKTLYKTFEGMNADKMTKGNFPNQGRGRWDRWAAMSAGNLIANELELDNPRFDREHFLAVVRGERDLNSRPPRVK